MTDQMILLGAAVCIGIGIGWLLPREESWDLKKLRVDNFLLKENLKYAIELLRDYLLAVTDQKIEEIDAKAERFVGKSLDKLG